MVIHKSAQKVVKKWSKSGNSDYFGHFFVRSLTSSDFVRIQNYQEFGIKIQNVKNVFSGYPPRATILCINTCQDTCQISWIC